MVVVVRVHVIDCDFFLNAAPGTEPVSLVQKVTPVVRSSLLQQMVFPFLEDAETCHLVLCRAAEQQMNGKEAVGAVELSRLDSEPMRM